MPMELETQEIMCQVRSPSVIIKLTKVLAVTTVVSTVFTCPCSAAYTGKTTTSFGQRFDEHFKRYHKSSINEHSKECPQGRNKEDYKLQLLENVFSRGKYTLSEREFLWNERLGGEINVQKILKNNWMEMKHLTSDETADITVHFATWFLKFLVLF